MGCPVTSYDRLRPGVSVRPVLSGLTGCPVTSVVSVRLGLTAVP